MPPHASSQPESDEDAFEDVPFDELSDAESVDEDVVPRQKVEIDNKVRSFALLKSC